MPSFVSLSFLVDTSLRQPLLFSLSSAHGGVAPVSSPLMFLDCTDTSTRIASVPVNRSINKQTNGKKKDKSVACIFSVPSASLFAFHSRVCSIANYFPIRVPLRPVPSRHTRAVRSYDPNNTAHCLSGRDKTCHRGPL